MLFFFRRKTPPQPFTKDIWQLLKFTLSISQTVNTDRIRGAGVSCFQDDDYCDKRQNREWERYLIFLVATALLQREIGRMKWRQVSFYLLILTTYRQYNSFQLQICRWYVSTKLLWSIISSAQHTHKISLYWLHIWYSFTSLWNLSVVSKIQTYLEAA